MPEFMDAQLSLTQAQSDLVTTYYAYLIALARIELSTGITSGLVAAETGGQQCRLPQWQPEP
jgi:outer membrane protein